MTAGITVDLADPVPPYEQIRRQLSSLIAVGMVEPGSRLPTVRSLAADLGIAAGTVARAYKELEQQGLIESRRRNGTVVLGPPDAPRGASGEAAVMDAVDGLIRTARAAGIRDDTLIDLVRCRLSSKLES
ncbi:GntR family transcriptional regulator [Paenarthrobacter aurescens]|uniref:GntR family transcriptional regulator n=1 Tax=Paenarthrobacter aurescens TaxID=43663 RepID=A0A4Y3NA18_PAEAU|nr:GntR family transcriptional regulator [Paenarthrobacter aurescens]MDO6144394.1 GntR family transcriptional regulator [Paenarthrobacter aurescens]MDO6148241.1 GntR family transcriptional regulator [Paenarthrobacter aurescens]MDO6159485.1 GntR family transcriptional regulator [Paenarthrobacter aurescens]MDO6163468.1 GntR family transcriptional regulator [Paenarthrobacter aurescens]GEB17957.1 GntR family transcriptional regulator [Paenarthrobacter aurescens]